jgi:hypothetical protein
MYHMVHRIHGTARSVASPEVLYALLEDPATWPAWSTLDSSEVATPGPDGPLGVGSIRAQTHGRVHGLDEIVELVPGKRFSYRHLRGLPVRDYRADVDLTPVGDGTEIPWQATFRPKYPGTGWFWRIALGRMVRQLAAGLAAYPARVTDSADAG